MKNHTFVVPGMAEVEFSVTWAELNPDSPLNQSEAHVHPACEVYVNLSGDVAFAVEDRLYAVTRGSVIVTMPYEYHHCIYRSNAPHAHYWITFSARENEPFLKLFFNREKGINNRIDLDEATLAELCQVLEGLLDGSAEGLQQRIGMLRFFDLLTRGSRVEYTAEQSGLSPDVAAALAYMEQHLREDIPVEALAGAGGVSVNTLERHFKQAVGATPFAMLRTKRLFASMMYLKSGSSVTEAAMNSGFTDCSHYIQLFKKKFGMTPSRYQKTVQGSENGGKAHGQPG